VLVDSHCHLAAEAFAEDRAAVLERAWAAGVGHIVLIGESPEVAERALEIAGDDSRLSVAAGLHPHEASRWSATLELGLRQLARDTRVVAIGETGLDYHYDHAPRARQREALEAQLGLARETGRPVVIHAREADEDLAAVLRSHPGTRGIMHSYSSGPELLDTAVGLGYFISFSGMLTFRNWGRDDLVRRVPLDRLLVETDAPYLAPVPHRGHRNEPAWARLTAERLAAVVGLGVDECLALTGENAARAFGTRLAA
jgi:TatD DNase family protein